jgi:DNA-binding GntR family transcriptional regulator
MPPKHAQVAETLRQRIDDGVYPEGGRLPSEAKLSAEFAASRTTVRQALLTLQNQGLVRAESGVGYFVRKLRHFEYRPQADFQRAATITDADSFTQAAHGRNPTQRIEVSIVAAPDDVARRMRLPEGAFVVLRSRLRFLDGEPYQINDSYYPREVAEGTEVMQPRDISEGVNHVLAKTGHAQVRALDEIWVRMPTPAEADRLRILPGTPVAEHVITGLTADDRVVRVVRVVLPGDRNVITFERTHPDHDVAGSTAVVTEPE